ncbi:MAG: RDD family protein, partial [Gaiellaceae bacterium]
PGSRVMRIRVVRANGSQLRPRHALARLVGMLVSLPLFWGYLPILVTDRRRGVFDAMAGTVVVTTTPEGD